MSSVVPTSQSLFTIGHSDHAFDAFIELLRKHEITAVADVRSSPYSQRVPHFNRELLAAQLERLGIRYVFMGQELGARRTEPECYQEGKARYALIAQTSAFRQGLVRVTRGLGKHRIALMCAEKDPLTCHRSILICRHLKSVVHCIQHILPEGTLELHASLEERLLDLAGLAEPDLFMTAEERLERAYDWQGEQIEYQEPRPLEAVT